MRCREWEERIALWAGGDLDDQAVERHLQECAECREFAAGLRESLDLLRGAHAEEIPAAAFTAVRARVLARLARPWWKRAWVYAAAAVVLLAARHRMASAGAGSGCGAGGSACQPAAAPVGQTIVFRRQPSVGRRNRLPHIESGWQATKNDRLPHIGRPKPSW